jgi:hypothetical protein
VSIKIPSEINTCDRLFSSTSSSFVKNLDTEDFKAFIICKSSLLRLSTYTEYRYYMINSTCSDTKLETLLSSYINSSWKSVSRVVFRSSESALKIKKLSLLVVYTHANNSGHILDCHFFTCTTSNSNHIF